MKLFLIMALISGFLGFAVSAQNINYARAKTPVVRPAFIPLPPGAVEPRGWLLDYTRAIRDSFSMTLDAVVPAFHAWVPGTTGWDLESSASYMDGLLRLGYVLHDSALIKRARGRLDTIIDNQGPAQTFMYWSNTQPPDYFDAWAHGLLGRVMACYYEGSNDNRVLTAIGKAYHGWGSGVSNWSTNNLNGGEGGRPVINWETMIEGYSYGGGDYLYDSINTTALLGTAQDWAANSLQRLHGVTWNELAKLPILFYPWTGDATYLNATKNSYQWLENHHVQPHGVNSSAEFLEGVDAFTFTETCDIACYIWSHTYLMRFDGDRLYGDRVERAFFNAFPQSLSRDNRFHVYFQAPNRMGFRTALVPGGCVYAKWQRPECCTGMLSRIPSTYISYSWMATDDNGLAAYLYGPFEVNALAGDHVPVNLACATNYPFNDTIKVTVKPQTSAVFPLYFRVPGWCSQPAVLVNGLPVSASINGKGFIKVERTWNTDDRVELQFPMTVRVQKDRQTTDCAPYTTVNYGPLLFALGIPELDRDNNYPVSNPKWKYALDADHSLTGDDFTVEHKPMPQVFSSWPFDAPITIKAKALPFDWQDTLSMPRTFAEGNSADTTISLIPYGSAKFRVSMFPITRTAWGDDVAEAADPNASYVGYWPLDKIECFNAKVRDYSVNQRDGVLGGNVSIVTGHKGSALYFDGNNSQCLIPDSLYSDIVDNFTISLWVAPAATRTSSVEVLDGGAGQRNQRYALYPAASFRTFGDGHEGAGLSVGTNGISVFSYPSWDKTYSPLVCDTPIIDWTHVTLVYDHKQPKLYMNGDFVKSGLTSANVVHPSLSMGGKDIYMVLGWYKGAIDELSFYPYCLTDAEIKSLAVSGTTSTDAKDMASVETMLHAVYPNPFNPESRIYFTLKEESVVNLSVYDLSGRCIKQLAAGYMKAGAHNIAWDGTGFNGRTISAGVYICRLSAGNKVMAKRMIFSK